MRYAPGMPNYRRHRVPGGTYFYTVNLLDRSSDLLTAHIDQLRAAFAEVRAGHPFEIDAIVVLPEHLHAVWTLPAGDADYPTRWRLIKSAFTRRLPRGLDAPRSTSRRRKGERGVWQRRFIEHTIRDDDDLARHVDYIHFNPVKHGLVTRPADWPYSSIHRYIADGVLPPDWGTHRPVDDLDYPAE